MVALAGVGAALAVHEAFMLEFIDLIVSKIHDLVSVDAKLGFGSAGVLTSGPHSAWEKCCAEVGMRTRLPFFSRRARGWHFGTVRPLGQCWHPRIAHVCE